MNGSATRGIALGDPVPSFTLPTLDGASVALHVDAGRWVVLAFLGALDTPGAQAELTALVREAARFEDSHLVAYAILGEPPPPEAAATLACAAGPAFSALADYDGAVARRFGAETARRSIVLDPLQRVIADIPWDHAQGHGALLARLLGSLPPVDESAGVPLWAPALVVPRIFDFELCDFLIKLYDTMGGEPSGFLLDRDGKSETVIDHHLKSRRDLLIVEPQLCATIRSQIVRRLLPAVSRFFSFDATRMDRQVVSCYDAEAHGHFFRHRDNINAGARHRRFAVSLALNDDYDGGGLRFAEFGSRTYRPPVGGAIVFSCGMLHEVTRVTRGRRFAFLPFLYGEADAALREANNARLHDGETHYVGGADRLYPEAAVPA